jgi:hypothetical protein
MLGSTSDRSGVWLSTSSVRTLPIPGIRARSSSVTKRCKC